MTGELESKPDAPSPAQVARERLSRVKISDSVLRLKPPAPAPARARGSNAAAATKTPSERLAVSAAPSAADFLTIKGALYERLLKEIGDKNLLGLGEEAVSTAVEDFVARILSSEDLALNQAERGRLADELREEALGLGPLTHLMADPAVSDILVNGFDHVYVERFGKLTRTDVRFRDDEHLIRVIERIAATLGRRIDMASPMLDARLKDGSRVNATIPPVSIDGPSLSIRRFGRQRLRREDLLRLGSWSADMAAFLELAVKGRKNILIAGGTGAGKSTLLGCVCEAIPEEERVVTIEDPAEIMLDQEHVVRFETRPANIEGRGRVTTRDLVINSLRMRPDRIIVGEVRGAEALDMLQAMNTGHDGSLSTIHANAPRDALARLETMVLMAGVDLPSRAIREQIVSAIEILVHVRRFEDGVRRVETISEITGMEGTTPLLQDIFKFNRKGQKSGRIVGEFVATGIIPRFIDQLRQQGTTVELNIFRRGERAPHA